MPNLVKRGSVGANVRFLQIRLNAGAPVTKKLKVDGFFGPQTSVAVLEFQTRSGLVPDGIVGPKTWRALAVEAAKRAAPINAQKFVRQLGTVEDFVAHVQHLEMGKPPWKPEVMRRIREFSTTANGRRYLIVRKGGSTTIIDFRHFFAAASEAFVKSNPTPLGGSRGDTLLLGLGNEIAQCIDETTKRQLNSCFSPEDLGSNRLGVEFGRVVMIRLAENSPRAVSELFAEYLHGLEPQPAQAVARVQVPSRQNVLLEAVTAILLGLYDAAIPDAY